jgi:hypothetical protein
MYSGVKAINLILGFTYRDHNVHIRVGGLSYSLPDHGPKKTTEIWQGEEGWAKVAWLGSLM